jgi:hypothetical protein
MVEQDGPTITQETGYDLTDSADVLPAEEVRKSLFLSVVWMILLLPSAFLSMFSVLMFDAPGSEDSLVTNTLVFSLMTAPISLLIGAVGGFMTKNSFGIIKNVVYLPVINIVLLGISLTLNRVVCHGQFQCWL